MKMDYNSLMSLKEKKQITFLKIILIYTIYKINQELITLINLHKIPLTHKNLLLIKKY